jgi:hypothetical protein
MLGTRTALACALLLAFAAIVVAQACGSGTPVQGFPLVDDAGCFYSCSQPCRGIGVCVPWPYTPSCQAPCNTSDDCASAPCLLLTTEGLPPSTSGVCAGAGALKICGADRACPPLAPMCQSAMTLMKPLTMAKNLCGYELVNCPNGCDSTNNRCNP